MAGRGAVLPLAPSVGHWYRLAPAVVLGLVVAVLVVAAGTPGWGRDFDLYMERTRSWLAGDGFYLPSQLAGPYPVEMGVSMYPPIALVLFVPFTVLPPVLWWLGPLGIVTAALWRLRLARWALAVLSVCLLLRVNTIVPGNPGMWAMAFVIAGIAWPSMGPLAWFRPNVLPFTLTGTRHRSWWITAVVVGVVAVAFGPMWLDYLTVARNAQGGPGYDPLVYALGDWPLGIVVTVAVWLGRR